MTDPTDKPHQEDYEVGYRKPPAKHRFKPGKSGNPKGRSKGTKNLVSALSEALNEKVWVTENGRRRRISKLDALAKQMVNKAAGGDARAAQQLIGLSPLLDQNAATSAATETPDESDQQAMNTVIELIRSRCGNVNKGDDQNDH